MIKVTDIPLGVASAAAYAYSAKLAKEFTFIDRFGETYEAFKRHGEKHIWLPRGVCPPSATDQRAKGTPVSFNLNWKPRNLEQARVVAEANGRLMTGQSFITQAPTGFGKTACTMPMIAAVGRATLIVVTKEDVKTQWYNAVRQFLCLKDGEIGVIQGNQCNVVGKKIVIAMVQSICKPGRYPAQTFAGFGLVIFDEVHRMGAEKFSQSIWQLPAKLRLGLSATPTRKDGRDAVFRSHIGPVAVTTSAIPMKPKVLVLKSKWKPPYQIKVQAGRTQHINKMLANDPVRNAQIVNFVKQAYDKGRNVVVFSELRVAHLDKLYDLLVRNGIKSKDIGYYVGGLTEKQREEAKVKQVVLATYAMCSEATDAPWWDTCVLGTPRSDVVQIVGRILREYEGKPEPVVMDIVDPALSIFKGYAAKREKWYHSIGSTLVRMN